MTSTDHLILTAVFAGYALIAAGVLLVYARCRRHARRCEHLEAACRVHRGACWNARPRPQRLYATLAEAEQARRRLARGGPGLADHPGPDPGDPLPYPGHDLGDPVG